MDRKKDKKQTAAQEEESPAAEESKENTAGAQETPAPQEEAEIPAEGETAPEDGRDAAVREAQALAEDYRRKWYAVTAEYENYRRRTANESARRYREGRSDVVTKLFPIADNLDRAMQSCGDEATKKGIAMVVKAFEKLLEDEHITAIDPVGQPFDAEKHEAIMAVDPAEGEESGTVKGVYLKGYEQDGKVLRFAQVIVVK